MPPGLSRDELRDVKRFVANGHRLTPGEITKLVATLERYERVVIAAHLVTGNGEIIGQPWWAVHDEDNRIMCNQCCAVGDTWSAPDEAEHDRDCPALEMDKALAMAVPSVAGLDDDEATP